MPADPEKPGVLASGLDHPRCRFPAWGIALVASASMVDLDGLAVALLHARQLIRAATRA